MSSQQQPVGWSRGRVVRWNDSEGYGFLAPDAGGADLFFHVSALRPGGRRPVPGDTVEYQAGIDEAGRPRAVAVRLPGAWFALPRPPLSALTTVAVFLAFVGLTCLWRGWSLWPVLLYLPVSLAAGIAYWIDKGRAERDEPRIPEVTLHMLDAAGGWPGSLLVSQTLRHKTQKLSFRAVFWLIAAAHWLAWAILLPGSWIWGYL